MATTMQINYPDTTQSLYTGMRTGMMLGSAIRDRREGGQGGNIPIADPGAPPQVDPRQAFKDEQSDFARIQELQKKTKGMSPNEIDEYFQSVAPTMKTAMGQKYLDSSEWQTVDIKEMNETLNRAVRGDPSAIQDMEAIRIKLGDTSPTVKAYQQKLAEVQGVQAQLKEQWAQKVKSTLLDMEDVRRNPKNWVGKNGLPHESIPAVMSQEGNYVEALWSMGGENKAWIQEYLKNKSTGRAGGGKPDQYVGKSRITGERITSVNNPRFWEEVEKGTEAKLGTEGELERAISNLKPRKGEKVKPPKPKGNELISPQVVQQYVDYYGSAQQGQVEALKDGWRVK